MQDQTNAKAATGAAGPSVPSATQAVSGLRVIIAGIRTLTNPAVIQQAMTECPFLDGYEQIIEVVCGCAAGADTLGAEWAETRLIPVKDFPADWRKFGTSAGPIRNRHMAEYADALVAIWDGKSRGTKNMIEEAQKRGLLVHIHRV